MRQVKAKRLRKMTRERLEHIFHAQRDKIDDKQFEQFVKSHYRHVKKFVTRKSLNADCTIGM